MSSKTEVQELIIARLKAQAHAMGQVYVNDGYSGLVFGGSRPRLFIVTASRICFTMRGGDDDELRRAFDNYVGNTAQFIARYRATEATRLRMAIMDV